MTRIRNPSQSKNMYRPNIIQKIRGSNYDDQSFPLKNKMVYFVLEFLKKGLTAQPKCAIIQMLNEAQTF